MDTLRTPFVQDIPQSFLFVDLRGKLKLAGAHGKILKNFAKYHNYKLQLHTVENPQMPQIQKDIEGGNYNLSMFPGPHDNLFANITFSYPLEWSKSCIMVPTKDELPRFWYVVWPFGPYIWTLLHLSVLYVAFYMRFLKHPSSKYAHNLLNSLAVVLFSSNMNLQVVNVSLKLQCFYFILLLLGFIVNNYYNSYLTVYHMRPIFEPVLRTVDDILKSNIKVLVPSHIFEDLSNIRYVNLSRLQPVLLKKAQLDISYYVTKFDRSFAYVVTYNDWVFLAQLQKHLIQPLFQLSDICFGNVFSTFPIRLDSKFASALNRFILQVHQAGLWIKWQDEAFQAALWAKYYHMLEDDYPADPLNLKYFRFAWIVFVVGSISSCICFVTERVIFKYKNKI